MNKSKEKLIKHETNIVKIHKFETTTHQLTPLKVPQIKEPSQKPSLIIMTLLNKIIEANKQQAFFKIILSGVTQNKKGVIARYLKFILTCSMNEKIRVSFGKVKNMSIRRKKTVNLMNLIGKWASHKITVTKKECFILFKSHLKDSLYNELEKESKSKANLKSTSSVDVKSSRTIKSSEKLISENKLKSLSVSHTEENNQNKNDQFIKYNEIEELRVMQLSEETREALKKIQRYDKVLYASESEKICGEIIANELKRLEKIKNEKREMRGQFYDNELTITALHNHIKLVHEMNKDLGSLIKFKETHTKEETKKKEQEFNEAMENKRNRGKSVNSESVLKKILANIEESLLSKNYVKLESDIHTVLLKYEHSDLVKDKIVIFQALYEVITLWKSTSKDLTDIEKISSNFANLNYSQLPQTVKTLNIMKKELTQMNINVSKEETNKEKSVQNLVVNFVKLNEFLTSALSIIQSNESEVEKHKSISIEESERFKTECLRINKIKSEFEKKVTKILEKQNKASLKKDISALFEEKTFIEETPYSEFHSLIGLIDESQSITIEKWFSNISDALKNITDVYEKNVNHQLLEKEVNRSLEIFKRKYPELQNIIQNISQLTSLVSKKTTQTHPKESKEDIRLKALEDQNKKLLDTERDKVKSLSEKIKELERANKESTARVSSLIKVNEKSLEKSQEKTESLKRTPIPSKSEELLKESYTKIQGELKVSNEKKILLEKELEMLKSQSKNLGADLESKKETAFQTQLNKSLAQIQNLIAAKNIKMLEIETNKLEKLNEKEREASLVIIIMVQMLREFLSNEKNKSKSDTVSTVSILDFLKNIENFISKKEFVNGETGWETIEAEIENEDRIGKSVLRILSKLNNLTKTKITEEKKLNQKLITNHELEIQKLNKSVSEYEKRLKHKEEQYQDIYKSLTELKNDRSKDKNDESASKSVIFRKSVISEKNSRLNDSNNKITHEEKVMEENIKRVTKEKTELTLKNVKLEKEMNRLEKTNEELTKTILNLENKYKQTIHDGSHERSLNEVGKLTKTNNELLEKVSSLKMEITKTKDYQEQLVLEKIEIALTKQEQDFNKFLLKHDEEIENHFYNVIIPDKLLSSQKGPHISTNQINEVKEIQFKQEIKQLREINMGLREKYEEQYRLSVENESQIKTLTQLHEESKAKFEETIKRLKQKNLDFENQIKHYQHNEENIQKYLHFFNISFNEALSGKVSTTIRSLYLEKEQTTTEVVEVVKEIIREDPKASFRIKELCLEIEESNRILKEYEVKMSIKESENLELKNKSKTNIKIEELELKVERLNENLSTLNKKYNSEVDSNNALLNELNKLKEEENKLKFDIRKCESAWEQRLYEQTRIYDTKLIEFHEQTKYPTTNREYDQILLKQVQTDNFKQVDNDKLMWESKYHELKLTFENKIKDMNDKSLIDLSKYHKEMTLLEQKNSSLLIQCSENDQKLKQLTEKLEKENQRLEREWMNKIENKVNYYEKRISEISSELSQEKVKSQSAIKNLSEFANIKVHGDDELVKENFELKENMESISRTYRKEMEILKEKVNHQKSENQSIQLLLKAAKEELNIAKSETQKETEKFENFKTITQRQILVLQSDHKEKMDHLIVENRTISEKMREAMVIEHLPRVVHSEITDDHFKIIELNSELENKKELMKQFEEINEIRRKEIEEEHLKLMATEREKEKYRSCLENIEITMMRVESDNKYLHSEVERLKQENNNYKNNKPSKDNDEQSTGILLVEINMLKEEIRKLKTIQTARNTPYQQTEKSNDFNLQINSKTKHKQPNDEYIQIEDSQYDQTELEILKKCSQEVSRLISVNRDLQIKCDILEGREENQEGLYEICQFFFNAKESMETLMDFVSNKMSENENMEGKYMEFMRSSKNSLKYENPNEYFELQTIFLQELFLIIIEKYSNALSQREHQIKILQQQIKTVITKKDNIFVDDNEGTGSEEQTLRKYENIFDDIKSLVKEFLDYGNIENIKMIWRCLEVD